MKKQFTNEKKLNSYIQLKKDLYNKNIRNLLDMDEFDIEVYNSLTNKELMTDENKLKISKVLVKEHPDIVKNIIKDINIEKYELELDILRNIIMEQENYEKLSTEQKEMFNTTIDMGRECLKEENYNEAYDWFRAGLYITKQHIFYYYIGKTFYKIRKNKDAKYWLNKYKNYFGGEKTTKAMLYLGRIYETCNKYDEAKNIFDIANNIDKNLGNSNHYVIKLYNKKNK